MSIPPFQMPPPPPDPNSPEGKAATEQRKQYLEALGLFVHTFAHIEAALFSLLGTITWTSVDMAKALFSGTRASAAMELISRVLEARQLTTPAQHKAQEAALAKYVSRLFTQLGIINGMRNHILHYGTANPDAAEPVVSNWSRALDEKRLKEVKVTVKDLQDMTTDLVAAVQWIVVIAHLIRSPIRPLRPELRALVDTYAWRYKSPLQGGKKGRNRGKPQKR